MSICRRQQFTTYHSKRVCVVTFGRAQDQWGLSFRLTLGLLRSEIFEEQVCGYLSG